MSTDMEALLLSVADAKKLIGIGQTKFYELMDAGELEVVKIGRKTMVTRASLVAFIERNTVKWAA